MWEVMEQERRGWCSGEGVNHTFIMLVITQWHLVLKSLDLCFKALVHFVLLHHTLRQHQKKIGEEKREEQDGEWIHSEKKMITSLTIVFEFETQHSYKQDSNNLSSASCILFAIINMRADCTSVCLLVIFLFWCILVVITRYQLARWCRRVPLICRSHFEACVELNNK